MGIKAHVICHTHWDREWYLTREQFCSKLVRLIDGLLDIVETAPDYVSFMLDGQTIAIEDYLAIKPYNKDRLFGALRSGKILSGPWYVLPDELLISGESHIRNYMVGTKVLEETGGKMKIAYLPDSFGHPCQMPQIVRGLGMDTMVFWRGTSNNVETTEFYWESPYCDSKVLCVHMPHGYGNSGNLSEDMATTAPRVQHLLDSLGAKSTTDVVLLMNGSDHITGQKNIRQIVSALGVQLPDYRVALSTMEQYLAELRLKLPELKTYTGEFRSGERSMLLGGTLSTRMYLKQKNHTVQKKLERYLEPMLALEKLAGGSWDEKGYLNYIWKKVLENHPHDSICGCSIDEVHREMMTRFACVEQAEDTLVNDTVERVKLLTQTDQQTSHVQLLLFEPTIDAQPSYREIEVGLDRVLVQEVNFTRSIIEDYEASITHPDLPKGMRVTDEQGREIPCVVLCAQKGYDTLYQDNTMPEIYKVNKIKLGLLLPGFAYGYHKLTVEKQDEQSATIKSADAPWIENEFYRVTVEGASLTVLDKKANKTHRDVAKLVDKGDAGDEYTYSWPQTDKEYTLRAQQVAVTKEVLPGVGERLCVTGVLELPQCLEANRKSRSEQLVASPVTMTVALYQGVNRIDFTAEIENNAKDHRLQVQFPSGVKTDYSESYDIFSVTKRPVAVTVPDSWMEYPQSTHPTHGFMNLADEGYGLSVSSDGLIEFEAEQKPEQTVLNLTLLRCVGWLSRTDLLTRKGNGGWTIATPEGQCLGKQSFSFSIAYHSGAFRSSGCFEALEKHRHPSLIAQMHTNFESTLGAATCPDFLNNLPKDVKISAFKPAENGAGVVLRLFNVGNEARECAVALPAAVKKASLVSLAEEWLCDMPCTDDRVVFTIQSAQIVTLHLML